MDRYIIYGTEKCTYCQRALMELRCRSIDTVWINLSDDPGYLKEVKEYYDFPTVPVILKNNLDTGKVSFVGGCAQLLEGLDD